MACIRKRNFRDINLWWAESCKIYLISRLLCGRSTREACPCSAAQSISGSITFGGVIMELRDDDESISQTEKRGGAQPDAVFRVHAKKLPAWLADSQEGYAE
jgi:hypothetical protein